MRNLRLRATASWSAVFLFVPAVANASGYALSDKSVSSLGYAFAGTAAFAEDASTLYNNPAGMAALDGRHISVGLHTIHNEATFSNEASTVSGENSTDTESTTLSPNFYYVDALSPDLRLGVGVFAPFGTHSDYDDDWRGRYHSQSTDLKAINLSPALALRVNERFSVGASIDIQYLDARLKQAVDFGTICVGTYTAVLGSQSAALAACNSVGLQPQQDDGQQTLTGESWAYGYTLGLTFDITDATRFGATLHSAVSHDIDGDSDFDGVPALPAFTSKFTDGSGSVSLEMPETVSLSLMHRASPALTLLGDATWTRWSSFDELRVDFDNTLPDAVTEMNWEDTWRYAVGAAYDVNDRWRMRVGYSDESSAIPDEAHRSPRSPDGHRRMYTVGVHYASSDTFSLDLAYAHVVLPDVGIAAQDSQGHLLDGDFEVSGQIASVQGNWKF